MVLVSLWLWRRRLPSQDLEASCWQGDALVSWMARVRIRAKAPRFGAGDGGAFGHHYLLGGVVVGILPVIGFRVKTLARSMSSAAAAHRVVTLLGTLSRSSSLIRVQRDGVIILA